MKLVITKCNDRHRLYTEISTFCEIFQPQSHKYRAGFLALIQTKENFQGEVLEAKFIFISLHPINVLVIDINSSSGSSKTLLFP